MDSIRAAPAGYELRVGTPSIDDYRRLRRIAGLSPKSEEAARIGLAATLFAVTVARGGEIVGMGRIVGDGGCFFQVTDIAVAPQHQGRGLGKRIVAALVEHLKANAPKSAYVSLIADGPARHLYARFGFEPTAPASIGMAFHIE